MKIAFLTLGCKLNYAETSTYERGFKACGMEVVPATHVADAYLVNTCAVTGHSESKCRHMISKCHRLAPDAAIIVTGCYAQLRRDEVAALPGVFLVFGAKEKGSVVSSSMEFLSGKPASEYKATDTLPAYSSGERTRSFLKVQDGCNNYCAYCTVPFARGNSRNIPVCEVVRQAEEIASKGVKEIVLTGVNTGDFGRSSGESFLDLLKALDKVEGIERYRISSIEPNLITEEIIDWIATGTKFQPHFHIPLQVGCDELLRKVGRRYDTDLFASRIDYIRKVLGQRVFFGIDVIVGLPGETDKMFEQTYVFLRDRIKPAFIHIFPYSKRPGTRAAVMPGQVQESVKTARVSRLGELCEALHMDFVTQNKGLPEKVLWESSKHKTPDGEILMEGYTGNYIRVSAPWDASLIGTIRDIVI
ncbi:MAG: tRNA (N(6)-L-threonylcarbamoyladenosine(37)-C(2))-methylthiotransferase MtaB [Bacteroidales bacterium]|nr:tRNA (N(6)-L-threonylcarbamoyladenosine(37)-C(2))-methylthiotransferase MtaB [Bacteroidales bacterium]